MLLLISLIFHLEMERVILNSILGSRWQYALVLTNVFFSTFPDLFSTTSFLPVLQLSQVLPLIQ